MKDWYVTREAAPLRHRGASVPQEKKIYLTKDQAKKHGKNIIKAEPPEAVEEVFSPIDWQFYQEAIKISSSTEPENELS